MRHHTSRNQLVLWSHHELSPAWAAPTGIRQVADGSTEEAGGHQEAKHVDRRTAARARRRGCSAHAVAAGRPKGERGRCRTRENVRTAARRSGL